MAANGSVGRKLQGNVIKQKIKAWRSVKQCHTSNTIAGSSGGFDGDNDYEIKY